MKRRPTPPKDFHLTQAGDPAREVVFNLEGRLSLENLTAIMADIQGRLSRMTPTGLTLDLSGVDYLDSAGALILLELESEVQKKSIPFALTNLSEAAQRIMGLIDREALATPPLIPAHRYQGLLERTGESTLGFLRDITQVLTFLGGLIFALGHFLIKPTSIRSSEVLIYLKRAGVEGLPIVGLLSLLLGLIIAFMSSLQLKQFGADLYVASLVSISMVKELGPIMTAILVAGRSGSAYAAEIGTMMVNEEVDALVTMGFDPVRFLAAPKVLATMIAVPVLTLYSIVFGLLGGLIIGVIGLDLTIFAYVKETQRGISLFDLISSLVKSVVFAFLVAGIGCQRGFQVRGGSEAVGTATTSAVVAALFLIIVTDSIFAVVLYYIR